jgi:hypothetical protein
MLLFIIPFSLISLIIEKLLIKRRYNNSNEKGIFFLCIFGFYYAQILPFWNMADNTYFSHVFSANNLHDKK